MKRLLPILLLLTTTLALRVTAAPEVKQEPDGEWGAIDLVSDVVEPGTKKKFTFIAQRSFEASFLDAPLWVARGASPGPTLCVTGGIHGDEINSVEIARRSFHAVDPQLLKGTLIVMPALNSLGLRTMNRYMIDRRDLNRSFPGSVMGSVAAMVANTVFERVIKRCDYLIDLHTGSNFRTNVAQIRVDMNHPASLELADNFGVGVVIGGAGPDGSLRREAVKIGVAAIIYEAGPPYVFVEREIENGMRGVLNAMDYLGIYKSSLKRTKSQHLLGSSWVRVPRGQGGIFLTTIKMGDRVKKGDLLGTVTDPVTDVQNEIRANRDGMVIGAALPQVVLSGYGIFHIGDIK